MKALKNATISSERREGKWSDEGKKIREKNRKIAVCEEGEGKKRSNVKKEGEVTKS